MLTEGEEAGEGEAGVQGRLVVEGATVGEREGPGGEGEDERGGCRV